MEKKHSKQQMSPQSENEISNGVEQALENFRRQIDSIDRQIVSFLAKRQTEVERIVKLKKAHNLPVYHPAREENLISERRDQGRKAGLDPDYLEELFRRILRQSRVEQAATLARKGIRPGATILLVGGKGGMGQYFHRWFSGSGYRVRILNREDWPVVETLCDGIDLALISVPIEITGGVIEKLGPYLPADAVLADITSIKVQPVQTMLEVHHGPVVGLHPLFGPATSSMDKQIIVVTPGRDQPACQWLIDQLSAWGSIILQSNAQEHDEIMGIVQTLRHFATFAFGQFLSQRRINLHRTLEFSSPIYRLELGMVGRLFNQEPSLYAEIILASPERRALLQDYLSSLNKNLEMIEKGDTEMFRSEFEKIAEWFGPFSEQAMRESTYLIDKLIERF